MRLQNPVTDPVYLPQVHQILEVVATNSRALLQSPRLPGTNKNIYSLEKMFMYYNGKLLIS